MVLCKFAGTLRKSPGLLAHLKTVQAIPRSTINIDPRQLMPHADASQQGAIVRAASQRLAIVTGGPGTGKTTTAAAIVAAKRTLFNGSLVSHWLRRQARQLSD